MSANVRLLDLQRAFHRGLGRGDLTPQTFELTLQRLGYGVMVVGGILFLAGISRPRTWTNRQEEISMYMGVLVFLVGVALTAFDLIRQRR